MTDYSSQELSALIERLGEPAFRARQIQANLFGKLRAGYDQMSDLPRSLRARLAETCPLLGLEIVGRRTSADGLTTKLLMRAGDGHQVEAVSIREGERHTVCVSSQVGCAMGCVFCASGLDGLGRNLQAGEIVEQVLAAGREFGRVSNLVFMGMGEPLANYDRLLRAIRILNDPQGFGLGARRMTVSTVGLVPGIRRLAGENLQLNLAVSLHAPDDPTRRAIVPEARRWPVAEIVAAAADYGRATGRKVTFEYVLLAGINDTPQQARDLAKRVAPAHAKLNLIPYNPVEGLPYRTPDPAAVETFRRILTEAGLTATVRKEKGRDVHAACGQLRRRLQTEEMRHAP